MKICLGVIDMQYDYGNTSATTFEVANILEEEYGLFTHFWEQHQDAIIQEAGKAVAYEIINHLRYGAPAGETVLLGDSIRQFNIFLEQEEMAGLSVDGVPTLAAELGINTRLKQQQGPRRPSFIDGGLFKSSFTAWLEDNAQT